LQVRKVTSNLKRFLKTFALLIASLFLVASGVDAALDHLSHSVTENSFTSYSQQGEIIFAYDGDLAACKTCEKPVTPSTPLFLHRS